MTNQFKIGEKVLQSSQSLIAVRLGIEGLLVQDSPESLFYVIEQF